MLAPSNEPNLSFESFSSPKVFLRSCTGFLCNHEAENNVLLSVTHALTNPNSPYGDYFLGAVRHEEIEGAFVMTPPFKMSISFPLSDEAIECAIRAFVEGGIKLSGISGERSVAERFSAVWARLTGGATTLGVPQICYELRSVNPTPISSGFMRVGTMGDLDLILELSEAFAKDIGQPFFKERAMRNHTVSIADQTLFLWDDGEVVSIAKASAMTPSGVRVGHVYTPPSHRGKGYASSLVAQVSEHMLAQGKKVCYLFTDAENPTSNKIYQRIGYTFVCEMREFSFG